jgi:probable F420-dependent oxidoreductase
MPVGLALGVWGETMAELRDAAREAEAGRFESIWVAELHRSAFVPTAALIDSTDTITVGTAIALAFVRSPMTTALSALDLDELSGGRFILGLGAGVRRLNEDWHNRPYGKPAPHLREVVDAIRRFVHDAHRGVEIEFAGMYEKAVVRNYQRPFPPVRETIPIYLAGMGPWMLRLAGEIGDGWIAHELGSAAYMRERALPRVREGIQKADRDATSVRLMASACCVPLRDGRQARRHAAGLVAFYASVRSYDEFFDFHGFLPQAKEVQRRFREGDLTHMADACPDEMVDCLTFAGTPDEVRARVAQYEGLVDVIKLTPPTHLVPPEVTRESQAAILEMFST